jgi:ferrochelatase
VRRFASRRPSEPLIQKLHKATGADIVEIQKDRIGVAVLNIGTPKTTETKDVRDYLRVFLGDFRVLDLVCPVMPNLAKRIILEIILLTRPKQSGKSYAEIWDEERGSPLLYETEDLVKALQGELGSGYSVKIGMRYSDPFIDDVMKDFAKEGISKVVLVPNFPQSASSSTGSALQAAFEAAAKLYVVPTLSVVPPFYADPGFIDAWANQIRPHLGEGDSRVDHLVLSFHGLPERHVEACDPTQLHCNKKRPDGSDCCAEMVAANRECYRAQCYETGRRIAAKLGLPASDWEVAFQSRLTLRGRIKWVEPYTDVRCCELAKAGKKRVAICAPSFAIDCLETIHELGVEVREEFEEAGGEELTFIPCINANPEWVTALAGLVRKASPQQDVPVTAGGFSPMLAVENGHHGLEAAIGKVNGSRINGTYAAVNGENGSRINGENGSRINGESAAAVPTSDLEIEDMQEKKMQSMG